MIAVDPATNLARKPTITNDSFEITAGSSHANAVRLSPVLQKDSTIVKGSDRRKMRAGLSSVEEIFIPSLN
ncbi:hypothetical protein TNCV_336601 [Trichonephila clavipes]|nr:hypothetical protein TNCV_336601 [Trichonephila clavipes]